MLYPMEYITIWLEPLDYESCKRSAWDKHASKVNLLWYGCYLQNAQLYHGNEWVYRIDYYGTWIQIFKNECAAKWM